MSVIAVTMHDQIYSHKKRAPNDALPLSFLCLVILGKCELEANVSGSGAAYVDAVDGCTSADSSL